MVTGYKDANFFFICVAPVCNGNNTLNHNIMNSRVANHKIPLNKTLLHTVHQKKKKKLDYSFP